FFLFISLFIVLLCLFFFFFFFISTSTLFFYTLSLHDALPILVIIFSVFMIDPLSSMVQNNRWFIYILLYYVLFLINLIVLAFIQDRKSTRLNSSHVSISYAVFCLKKKNII